MKSLIKTLATPRMMLIAWGVAGALFIVYVMIASAVQRPDRPGARPGASAGAEAPLRDPRLLKGEVADFVYAPEARFAPDTVFNDDEGGAPTRLADFRGKGLVVNFWATWCAPCRVELPSLDALAARLTGEGVEVLLVAADPKGRAAAETMLADLGVSEAKLLMDDRLALISAMGGAPVLPVTVVYDREGREVGRLVGEVDWSSPEAEALVRRAVGG